MSISQYEASGWQVVVHKVTTDNGIEYMWTATRDNEFMSGRGRTLVEAHQNADRRISQTGIQQLNG